MTDAMKYGNLLLFKIDNLARADAVTYTGDKYGATAAVGQRKSTVDDYKKIAANQSSDETIFKNGLFLLTDIDTVKVADASTRKQVLDVFKKHGVTVLPDGRKIEDVVKISD